jgi:hypothetical protein
LLDILMEKTEHNDGDKTLLSLFLAFKKTKWWSEVLGKGNAGYYKKSQKYVFQP